MSNTVFDFIYRHLVDAAWALIAHEKLTGIDERYNLFSEKNDLADLPLEKRLFLYSKAGQKLDPTNSVINDEIKNILKKENIK